MSESKPVLRSVIGLVKDLHPTDLEQIVRFEVQKYRSLVAEASGLYDQWQCSEQQLPHDAPATTMEKAYILAMIAQQAQQTVVSTLLDVFGEMPDMSAVS